MLKNIYDFATRGQPDAAPSSSDVVRRRQPLESSMEDDDDEIESDAGDSTNGEVLPINALNKSSDHAARV